MAEAKPVPVVVSGFEIENLDKVNRETEEPSKEQDISGDALFITAVDELCIFFDSGQENFADVYRDVFICIKLIETD